MNRIGIAAGPKTICVMKKAIFFFLFVFAISFSFANETGCDVSCDTPANVTKVSQSSGTITFDWDDCSGGCSSYEVRYVRLEDGYVSSFRTVSSSSATFTGLADGEYEFQFRTVCSGGVSSIIGVEEVIWG